MAQPSLAFAGPPVWEGGLASVFSPITIGSLEVFLASTPEELWEAQKLRYRIFHGEFGAQMEDPEAAGPPDSFDLVCDHLLVRDTTTRKIVGSYRLARRKSAEVFGTFYTASEYDISPLLAQPGDILELSRSCVEQAYRSLPTMHLLWRGLAEYALGNEIALFFGCVSFYGTNPKIYEQALSYLHYTHLAPESFRARVRDGVDMCFLKAEEVDLRKAMKQMPPLLKGYIRIGGVVGEGVFVDHAFNTTDVLIVVRTDRLTQRYANYYNTRSTQKSRFA